MSKIKPLPFGVYLKKMCGHCGSTDVWVDAKAYWNFGEQKWKLDDAFPDNAFCNVCGGETTVKETELLNPDDIRKELANG